MKPLSYNDKKSQAALPEEEERRSYQSPQLLEYGTIQSLTQGGVGTSDDVEGTTPNMTT